MINIQGLPKHRVLRALFNGSKQQGLGFMCVAGAQDMTEAEAEAIIDRDDGLDFDYLMGRVMKVNIAEDQFRPFGYDRDNGDGAAGRAIDRVRTLDNENKAG